MSGPPRADRAPARSHLSDLALVIVEAAGSTLAWAIASAIILVWVAVGLAFGFTDSWFSVLFTVTGTVTFIMVFVIQHTTDRQQRAILLKLDELVHVAPEADNELIGAERLPLHEQDRLERGAGDRHAVAGD